MKKFVLTCLLLLPSISAHAQALPAEVLDKEYDNCLQQGGPVTAQKQAYCQCMRNKMAGWTEDAYEKIAKEVMGSGTSSPTLEALAKECFNATSGVR